MTRAEGAKQSIVEPVGQRREGPEEGQLGVGIRPPLHLARGDEPAHQAFVARQEAKEVEGPGVDGRRSPQHPKPQEVVGEEAGAEAGEEEHQRGHHRCVTVAEHRNSRPWRRRHHPA